MQVTLDERLPRLYAHLEQEVVGKRWPLKLALIALLSGGHALLEDVPGVGKTLLARALARAVGGRLGRIQFTPDLLPADITGSSIWNPQRCQFEFVPGPVFANIVLADEINRATPRTQSALLEVMEEQQVTTDGVSRAVPEPFFVIATQNPIEYQGTFVLPEAQLDRFALAFSLGYPSEAEELEMLRRPAGSRREVEPALSAADIAQFKAYTAAITVSDPLRHYILALVRSTRTDEQISLGVSPRGAVALQRAGQALAFLEGRDYVLPDDIKRLASAVLTHRIVTHKGHSASAIVTRLLETTPIP